MGDRARGVRARVRHRHARDPPRRRSVPASGSSSSTTCWPPAAPRRRPVAWSRASAAWSSGFGFLIELGFLGGRASSARAIALDWPRAGAERCRARGRPGCARLPTIGAHRRGHRRPGPALAAPQRPAGRGGRAAARRLPRAPPEGARRPSITRAYERGRARPTPARPASRASPTSTTRWRWPRSWPTSASTTSRSSAALLHDAVEDTGITAGRRRARVRRRGGRHRRRRHQARAHPVRLQGGPAGRHHAQDAGGDGQGPAGPDHQAGRPPAQHAHHRGHAGGEAGAHRPGDARHLRAAGPPPRHAGDEAAARGPRVRGAAPEALRRDRPHGRHPDARARRLPRPRCSRRCATRLDGAAASTPRSPAGRSTSGASTRRWS